MRLSQRIAEAGLSAAVARTFAAALREVARADGPINDLEARLIRHLVEEAREPVEVAAPFEALWSHAERFLAACVYVAVSDGEYGVEEARVISLFAHRLGYSVRRLAALEERTFATLRAQAPSSEDLLQRRTHPPEQERPGMVEGGRSGSSDPGLIERVASPPPVLIEPDLDEFEDGEEVTEPLHR